MDRLLAVNEAMALYYHDESLPTKQADPFKYLNALLSIRSAKGLVSFLQQYPEGLQTLHDVTAFKSKKGGYVVGRYPARELLTARSKRSALYGKTDRDAWHHHADEHAHIEKADVDDARDGKTSGDEEEQDEDGKAFFSRLDFGQTAMMNAAAEINVDYFDALTDLEKYTHYGEALTAWRDGFRPTEGQWTKEDTEQYYKFKETMPKPELRLLFIPELEWLTRRLDAILMLGALSLGLADGTGLFEFEHVNEPMGLCKTTIPDDLIANLLPVREGLYAIENLYSDFYSHAPNRLHLEDDEGVYFVAHTNDEELATQDAAGVIVSFVLDEWSHYYNKTDVMSFDVNFGYRLYEQQNNEIVTELCHVVAEGRLGICPVCGRPFVVKRRPVNGVINKRFCTNSCKVKGFAERRAEEGQE